MKKSRLFTNSASAIATGFALFASVAHAGTVVPDPEIVVVDGSGGTGYVVTDVITTSTFNPNVLNPNKGAITLDGASAESGYNSLTVGNSSTETVFSNFTTTGGSGSGGGAGLGGVFFVDDGQTLTLRNVSMMNNAAQGGTGGIGVVGGSMNSLVSPGTAATGQNGANSPDGYGNVGGGSGGPGYGGYNGADAAVGVGGTGGRGGNGSNGIAITADTVWTALNVAYDAVQLAKTTKDASDFTAIAGMMTTAAATAFANPMTASLTPEFTALSLQFTAMAAAEAAQATEDLARLTADTAYQVAMTITAYELGASGAGGSGGSGGTGGDGGRFFSGGVGGAGGYGGFAIRNAVGGEGGSGGDGGFSGFGAGGASGGSGGAGGASGSGVGGFYLDGDGGAGGEAGFGGGVGSSRTNYYGANQSYMYLGGGGGSGFGGAIFVADGGTLNITGNALFANNYVMGGSSENDGEAGQAAGTDLFMMKGSTVNLEAGIGNTIRFEGTIADDSSASIDGTSIVRGAGASIQIGAGGLVQFAGENTYTGTTFISGATLDADIGVGINEASRITFKGAGTIGGTDFEHLSSLTAGVLLTSGEIVRQVSTNLPVQVSWAGSGGFAAEREGLTLNFGKLTYLPLGQQLTWGSGGFVGDGDTLVFGSDYGTGVVTLINSVNMNGLQGRIAVYDNKEVDTDWVVLSGKYTNGTLEMNDTGYTGTAYFTNQNTLSGFTLNEGYVSTKLGSQIGRLMDATNGGDLTVRGGELYLASAEKLKATSIWEDGKVTAASNITSTGKISNYGQFSIAANLSSAANIDNFGTGNLTVTGTATAVDILNLPLGKIDIGGTLTARDINNDGEMRLQSGGSVRNLFNLGAGTFEINGDLSVTQAVRNMGIAEMRLGADITAGYDFINQGVVQLLSDKVDGADEAATRKITADTFAGSGTVKLDNPESIANSLILDLRRNSHFSGSIIGGGAVTKTGQGVLSLSGTNTFTGGLNVNAGGIALIEAGTLAKTLDVSIASGALFYVDADNEVRSITNAGTLHNLAALTVTSLTNTGTATNSDELLVRGNMTNSGQFTSTGKFEAKGNVSNAADGTITLNSGSTNTLESLTNSGTINAASAVTVTGAYVQNGGTLTTNSALATGSLSGTGGTITLNNNAAYTVNQTANGTFAGTITGSGTVNKTGTATLTLKGGTDSFSPSAVNIQQGTLAVDGAGILDDALAVNVSSGATLALITGNQTINNLTGTGSLALNGNDLFLDKGGSFDGTVSGTGNVKLTSGTFNLTNTINSTSGNFQVQSNSTMNVAATGTLNAPVVDVFGTLVVQGTVQSTTTNVNRDGTLQGSGTVTGTVVVGGSTVGTLRPGNSPGVITMANLTLDNNSATIMEIEGNAGAGLPAVDGGYDLIVVTGKLALRPGSLLEIANSNDFELNLGQKVKIFDFAPGAVSGQFGSVTNAFSRSVAFNLATGTVVGLGSYTPSSFESAIAKTANEVALVNQLRVGTTGGVNQYYGGRLIEFAASALAGGNAADVATVFAKASPEAYVGLMDHMKLSMLDNRLELGGYETVDRPTYFMTGSVNLGQAKSRERAGYLRYESKDHRFNIGAAAQLPVGRVQVSYARTDGDVESTHLKGDITGNQYSIGASAPVALDGALRLAARFAYGDYAYKGTRVTNEGTASFGNVNGSSTVWGGGFEYLKSSKRLSVGFSAEVLSVLNKVDSFTETGVGALESLTVHAQRERYEVLGADLKLGYEFQPGIQGFMAVSLDQDLSDRLHAVSANVSVESVNMTVMNPGFSATRVDGTIGARFDLTDAIRFTIEGNAGNASRYGGKAAVSIRF